MWALLCQEVDRLEHIAERFLSFARPSKPDRTRQPFGHVYERVGELVRAQKYQANGIELEVTPLAAHVAAQTMRVDRDQLAHVVLNISANALRAMKGHGTLRLAGGLREVDGARFVTLRLENDGPTIAAADMERIFDPFCTRSKGGTGLGLAIAERIAEEHEGFLEVENTGHERGVAFTVVLPQHGDESLE